MPLQKRHCPNAEERPIVRKHSSYSELRGPVVPDGFVAARVRAIQEAYSQTPKSQKCVALRSLKQGINSNEQRRQSILPPTTNEEGAKNLPGRGPNPGEDDVQEERAQLFKTEEQGDVVGDEKEYAARGRTGSNEGLSTHRTSDYSNEPNGERKPSNEEPPDLTLRPTRRSSIGLRVKKSFMSLRTSPDQIPTSLDESHRPKKFQIRRNPRKKPIPFADTDSSVTIGPLDTGQPFSYPLASPTQIQETFTLSPSAPARPEITDPIELRHLSAGPKVTQFPKGQADESLSSFDQATTSNTSSNKHQESPTPTKTPRRSISITSLKPPSLLSSTPSTTQGVRKRWSWWKLGGQQQPPAAEEVSDNSVEQLFISPLGTRGQNDDGPASVVPVPIWHTALDPGMTGAIAEQEDEDDTKSIDTARQRDSSIATNEEEVPTSMAVLPALATFSASHPTPKQPDPEPPSQPSAIAGEFDTIFQQGSSGAASSAQLQTSDTSSRSVKWLNRGQRVKRVQVIVNLDIRELGLEANAKLEGKKARGKGG